MVCVCVCRRSVEAALKEHDPNPIVQPGEDLADITGEQLREIWLARVRSVMVGGAVPASEAAAEHAAKRQRTVAGGLDSTWSTGSSVNEF